MSSHSLIVVLLLTALAAAPAARAELFKWVGEDGVVNYGDRPPADARDVKPLDEADSKLSVVPGIPREDLDRMREREAQARLDRLEREVAELRAREVARATAPVIVEASEPVVYGYPVYPAYPKYRPRHRIEPLPAGPYHPAPKARPSRSEPPVRDAFYISVRK